MSEYSLLALDRDTSLAKSTTESESAVPFELSTKKICGFSFFLFIVLSLYSGLLTHPLSGHPSQFANEVCSKRGLNIFKNNLQPSTFLEASGNHKLSSLLLP